MSIGITMIISSIIYIYIYVGSICNISDYNAISHLFWKSLLCEFAFSSFYMQAMMQGCGMAFTPRIARRLASLSPTAVSAA